MGGVEMGIEIGVLMWCFLLEGHATWRQIAPDYHQRLVRIRIIVLQAFHETRCLYRAPV